MASNLTNVYAHLRKSFENVDMMLSKPSSFVKTLGGSHLGKEKVCFVFKEDRSRLLSPTISNNNSNCEKTSNSLNLTGSPLRDDRSIDEMINNSIASKISFSKPWKDEEECFAPIEINLARKILNNVKNQSFPKDSQGWIFLLCQDEAGRDNTFLLSDYVSEKDNVRGFATYHGVVKHHEKSIETLKNLHNSIIPATKFEAQMESVFQITPDISLRFINHENPKFNHINDLSEVELYQKVEIGRSHILCEDFWNQIQLLNMIRSDIMDYKNNTCDASFEEPPRYKYGQGDVTFQNLQEKVSHIMSDVQTIKEDKPVIDNGLESVIKRTKTRQLTEITDQLWDLLKFTHSYSDLKKIITFIFQTASRSNVVNLPTNKTRLGELIRELCQQRLAIPNLQGTEPLELLLEIGIEKIMKDFEFIFVESQICQLANVKFGGEKIQTVADNRLSVRKSLAAAAIDLNSEKKRKTVLKANSTSFEDEICNSRFNERETEKKISKLTRIYLVMEHLLLIQNNLAMDNDYATIAKKLFEKPLVPFESLGKFDKFEFVIKNKKVSELVDNLMPNAQKITFTSNNKFKEAKSVFYFNIEQIVPALAKEKEEIVGDAFHFISYSVLTSKY